MADSIDKFLSFGALYARFYCIDDADIVVDCESSFAILADSSCSDEVCTILHVIHAFVSQNVLIIFANWGIRGTNLIAITLAQCEAGFTAMTLSSEFLEVIAMGYHWETLPIRIVEVLPAISVLNADSGFISYPGSLAISTAIDDIVEIETRVARSGYACAAACEISIVIGCITAVWTRVNVCLKGQS